MRIFMSVIFALCDINQINLIILYSFYYRFNDLACHKPLIKNHITPDHADTT